MSELQSLSQIFNKRIFRIPDYQRGYAWEKKQLEDFWSDLENANSKKKHFFGTFFLEKKERIYLRLLMGNNV